VSCKRRFLDGRSLQRAAFLATLRQMASFSFTSPLLPPGATLPVQQDVRREIGFKLYPGALVLAKFLEASAASGDSTLPPPGSAALELGAGVCGLPSVLLAAAGCSALATDVPAVVPLLRENLAAGAAALRGSSDPHRLRADALTWGTGDAAARRAAAAWNHRTRRWPPGTWLARARRGTA
jgi:hypothetical protein